VELIEYVTEQVTDYVNAWKSKDQASSEALPLNQIALILTVLINYLTDPEHSSLLTAEVRLFFQ
jgi:hypothetical protein